MHGSSRNHQLTFVKVVAAACVLTALPVLGGAESPDHLSKEEYEIISVTLGTRNERVFIDESTSSQTLDLREAVYGGVPTAESQPSDSALTRARNEPSEAVKRLVRAELTRRREIEAFKAEISAETIDNWTEKNARSYKWQNHFRLSTPAILLTVKTEQILPGRDHVAEYWNQLRATYPDLVAIEHASRVGFNRSRSQAVVLISSTAGPVGGEGEYVLLEKKNGRWAISHRMRAWLS